MFAILGKPGSQWFVVLTLFFTSLYIIMVVILIYQYSILKRYNYKFIPLVLLVIDFLFNLLWPFINQYQQQCCNKISKLDIDTLLSDFIFELLGYLFQRKLVNGLLGSLEMFNVTFYKSVTNILK